MNADRAIRVLLLCDRLDIAGGVERFVCSLANRLSQEGMAVAVGSVDTPASAVHYRLDASVRVLCGARAAPAGDAPDASRWRRGWRLWRAQWRIGRSLSRLIRDEQPDVVVLNGLTTACSTLAMARRFSSRAICCDHNHFEARSRPWQWLRRRLYPRVAAVVSLTEADAPRFRALNPRTEVIYNASTLRADAPALPATPNVLAVGRHVAQKGFDLLLRSWALVLRALPDARLRIVGDGPLRAATERLAQELGVQSSIEWLAPTEHIERRFREAAVFVLPSRYEGMPLALLEAQAMGVPAVAFDCPTGPAEIITADTGRLVPAGDVDGLAQALVSLLRTPALRERMGHAAIARSRAVFDPETHAQRWTALVRRVAGGRGARAAA
jgi:glycosyltransferase involved in cell wall biosynthesis